MLVKVLQLKGCKDCAEKVVECRTEADVQK